MKCIIILLISLFMVSTASAEESKKYAYIVYSDLSPAYSNRNGDNFVSIVMEYESKEECEKALMKALKNQNKVRKKANGEDIKVSEANRITADKWDHLTLMMVFDDRTVYNVCIPISSAWKSR